MGSRNGEGTVLDCYHNISKGNGRRLAGVAVDNLEARLRRTAWSHQHLKGIGDVTHTEVADILGVYNIRQAELLTNCHVRRGIGSQRLRHHLEREE